VDTIPILMILIFYGAIAGILVYLIFKRIGDKAKEDFEKRDN
jgi:hypothetical protein